MNIPATGGRPGTWLAGRYRFLRKAGRGLQGTVYLAEDSRTGQPVAVKVCPQWEGMREANLLAWLAHPLIPPLFECQQHGDLAYLVIEWVPGRTLFCYRGSRGARLRLAEIFSIGFQLCEVFAYLHSLRPPVFFQDLHPKNVLLRPDGRVALIDFGLAERCQPTTSAASVLANDLADVRRLLCTLLPSGVPGELAWQIRGTGCGREDAQTLRAALEALRRAVQGGEGTAG